MTEEITSPTKSKLKLSPYLIIFAGSIIASFIAINLILLVGWSGMLTPWRALPAPPSAAESIIGIAAFGEVLVKSKDGKTYTNYADPINCRGNRGSSSCFTWGPTDDVFLEERIPDSSFVKRGNDCETLQPDIFPKNPRGQLVECVAYQNGFLGEFYAALMTNGEIFYWYHYFRLPFSTKHLLFPIFIFSVIVAVIVSILHAVLQPFLLPSSRTSKGYFIFLAIVTIIIVFLLWAIINSIHIPRA